MFSLGTWAPIVLPVVLGGHHRKIIPYDMNGPFKQVMMTLFRLAWSSKIRLPLLITVAFLALDVNLQVEINVFWAPADRDQGEEDEERQRQGRRRGNGIGVHRGILPPAPLAQIEEFENDSAQDEGSDSDSSGDTEPSVPSDSELPPPRFILQENVIIPNFDLNHSQGSEGSPRSTT